ncbi:uncharacterized protein LOC132313967 [Cornus florida]|uniref:uncharacterized protein LOC132313967 n=1 Tax=Cornus florida TaxID=4283 RepID=UPI002899C018|nr:uncharacterized protein LOC132313967 [Cornus florida]
MEGSGGGGGGDDSVGEGRESSDNGGGNGDSGRQCRWRWWKAKVVVAMVEDSGGGCSGDSGDNVVVAVEGSDSGDSDYGGSGGGGSLNHPSSSSSSSLLSSLLWCITMKSSMVMMFSVAGVVLSLLCVRALGKECVNNFGRISIRAQYGDSANETWKEELLKEYDVYRRDVLDGPDALLSASSYFPTGKPLTEEDIWKLLPAKMRNVYNSTGFQRPNTLQGVSLHDVRITDPNSIYWQAQQTNLDYMLMLDVDSLVWSFRDTADLPTKGKPYGGWERPNKNGELRGHFVGHYLSASALMWATTHNNSVKEQMTAVVSALAVCQDKIGTGYLSAFEEELFDRIEQIEYAWAPYYTLHKVMAGLLDQYKLAGNEQAFKILLRMVEYFYKRTQNVISMYTIERHYNILNMEYGGLNELFYQIFGITKNRKHLLMARLFDKPCFLAMLALQADELSGFHTNTHIPIVVGVQTGYEITGDPLYKDIAKSFMEIVNSSHAYATGGTSQNEFWQPSRRMATTLSTENEETCASYNMLKVGRNLFRWTKDVTYADYYERTLTNSIMGVQRGRIPGEMIYMKPLCHGCSKAHSVHGWGNKFNSFWCCYGTGLESFAKLGDSIYFEEQGKPPGLYIIQYISSTVDWKMGQIFINQTVKPVNSWESHLQVNFTISSKEVHLSQSSTLNFRIPGWVSGNGVKASLNGQGLPQGTPGKFLSVTRQWNSGDKITLELPLHVRTEAIKDERPKYDNIKAILYGPYLLAAMTTRNWTLRTGSAKSLSEIVTPIPPQYHANLISLHQGSGDSTVALTKKGQTLLMASMPQPRTNKAIDATFRLILKEAAGPPKWFTPKEAIGKLVMLEPLDFPGSVVVHQGTNKDLMVAAPGTKTQNSIFHLVPGLSGKDGTVSLESGSQKGCFVSSAPVKDSDTLTITLRCQAAGAAPDAGFKNAASFVLGKSAHSYHPVSFVAQGAQRNFLLTPFNSFMDEYYTLYFKFNP